MDNVDTDGRRCVSVFAPLCVHIYKGHQSHHPPRIGEYIDKRPAEGVQLSRPPDMNDTDNEGKASTDEKETDPDTDKYRQHGQTPAALRLYTTHKRPPPTNRERPKNYHFQIWTTADGGLQIYADISTCCKDTKSRAQNRITTQQRETPRKGGAASTQPALIWTTTRRVEVIQAHRHEGQTEEEQTASTDEKQTAARYRQHGQPPRRMEKRRPPPRRSFARVQRLPFTALHCKTRGVSCSRRQTPRRVEKGRPPRAVLLPRVQRSPFRLTYHPPRPFRAAGGQSPKASTQHRRGVQRLHSSAPNMDNVDNMDNTAPAYSPAPDMDKYRQHGQPPNIEEIIRHAPNMDNVDKRPDVWRRGGRPVLFFCPVCSVRPFVGRITSPVLFAQQEAKASTQTRPPRGCNAQTPPDMAAPRIEAIRYENNRPRPTNRERPKRRRERRGCSVHTARPNIDNVDNMDTDGRRVEAIPHEQEKQTAPNMDNVDNRTQTRPPCGEEEAAPALFFWYHKPAPFSCSRRRKPESSHPPRRGVQRPHTPPRI